jgi:ABC-type lipopolysaccharide export system ATPase subunit
MNSVFFDEFNIALLRIHENSNILNSYLVPKERSIFCVISIKNQIANKLAEVEADRRTETIESASHRSQFKTLKHLSTIRCGS